MRPHVETAFERHLTIEADDRGGHGKIKREHGAEPEEHLRTAQPRGHSHPRTTHHAQNLGQHQIAETKLAPQSILYLGLDLRSGHRVKMVAHRAGMLSESGEVFHVRQTNTFVPVGILAFILVQFLVEDPPYLARLKKGMAKFDYVGFSLLTVGVGALQVLLDKGQEDDWF